MIYVFCGSMEPKLEGFPFDYFVRPVRKDYLVGEKSLKGSISTQREDLYDFW